MRQQLILTVLCGVMALGAAGVAVWALASGQVWEQGIDGPFLVIVCLLTALVFAPIPFQAVRRTPLRSLLKGRRARSVQSVSPTPLDEKERIEQRG